MPRHTKTSDLPHPSPLPPTPRPAPGSLTPNLFHFPAAHPRARSAPQLAKAYATPVWGAHLLLIPHHRQVLQKHGDSGSPVGAEGVGLPGPLRVRRRRAPLRPRRYQDAPESARRTRGDKIYTERARKSAQEHMRENARERTAETERESQQEREGKKGRQQRAGHRPSHEPDTR